MQRAPLSTNGEQVRDYHPKFEGGKAVSAVVMPPQAHRELQGKQNKTKQNKTKQNKTKQNKTKQFVQNPALLLRSLIVARPSVRMLLRSQHFFTFRTPLTLLLLWTSAAVNGLLAISMPTTTSAAPTTTRDTQQAGRLIAILTAALARRALKMARQWERDLPALDENAETEWHAEPGYCEHAAGDGSYG